MQTRITKQSMQSKWLETYTSIRLKKQSQNYSFRMNIFFLVSSKSKLKQSLTGSVDLQQCVLGLKCK